MLLRKAPRPRPCAKRAPTKAAIGGPKSFLVPAFTPPQKPGQARPYREVRSTSSSSVHILLSMYCRNVVKFVSASEGKKYSPCAHRWQGRRHGSRQDKSCFSPAPGPPPGFPSAPPPPAG